MSEAIMLAQEAENYARASLSPSNREWYLRVAAALRSLPQPSEAVREALKTAREEIVIAIAFLARDAGTERLAGTANSLTDRLAKADAKIIEVLSATATGSDRSASEQSHEADFIDREATLSVPASAPEGVPVAWQEPTDSQVDSACLSFSHDFGLIPEGERNQLRFLAREWLHAWRKEGFGCDQAEVVERCAAIVDQCNREGPYQAIAAAPRIRALKHAPPAAKAVGDETQASLLRGAKSFGAVIDDPRSLRVGFDRPVTDEHRAALLAAINAFIAPGLPDVRGAVIEECLGCEPQFEVDPIGDNYQRGRSDGITEYSENIRALQPATPATGG